MTMNSPKKSINETQRRHRYLEKFLDFLRKIFPKSRSAMTSDLQNQMKENQNNIEGLVYLFKEKKIRSQEQ